MQGKAFPSREQLKDKWKTRAQVSRESVMGDKAMLGFKFQAQTSGLDFEWEGEGWKAAPLLSSYRQMAEPEYTSKRLHYKGLRVNGLFGFVK